MSFWLSKSDAANQSAAITQSIGSSRNDRNVLLHQIGQLIRSISSFLQQIAHLLLWKRCSSCFFFFFFFRQRWLARDNRLRFGSKCARTNGQKLLVNATVFIFFVLFANNHFVLVQFGRLFLGNRSLFDRSRCTNALIELLSIRFGRQFCRCQRHFRFTRLSVSAQFVHEI